MSESGRDALEIPNQLVPQRPQLAALTAARFFAAFQVLLFHLWGMDGLTWTPKWLQTFASAGYTGVTFFFVLSGFIFVYTYADKPINLREFWRARLAHLCPYTFWRFCSQRHCFSHRTSLRWRPRRHGRYDMGLTVALVLTIMQAWIPQAALGWNVVSWSVSVEIFFYSMFPWLIARLRNISNRGLVLVGGASWAVSVSLAVIYALSSRMGPFFRRAFPFWRLMVVCNPLLRLPEFLFGLACGIWFVREQHTAKWATLLTLLGVGGVLGPIAASSAIPHPILATGLMAPAYAAVICGLALRPRWIAALERPLLVLLGEASYALYLLHGLVLIVAMFIIQPNPNGPVSPIRALMATCAAVLVSVLVFRFVDAPLRRRLRGQKADQSRTCRDITPESRMEPRGLNEASPTVDLSEYVVRPIGDIYSLSGDQCFRRFVDEVEAWRCSDDVGLVPICRQGSADQPRLRRRFTPTGRGAHAAEMGSDLRVRGGYWATLRFGRLLP